MAEITVSQLAKLVKIDAQMLLKKLEESGIHKDKVSDLVTDAEKNALLSYIQTSGAAKKQPLTLQRKKTTQLKVAGNRKVNIEVRKKKTLVKPKAENLQETAVEAQDSSEGVSAKKQDDAIHAKVSEKQTKADVAAEQKQTKKPAEVKVEKKAEKSVSEEALEPKIEDKKASQDNLGVEENKPAETAPQPSKPVQKASSGFNIISKPEVSTETADDKEADTSRESAADKENKKKAKKKGLKPAQSVDLDDEGQPKKSAKKIKGQKKQSPKSLYQYDEAETLARRQKFGTKKAAGKVKTQQFTKPVEQKAKQVVIYEGITVNELAQKMAVKAAELIKILIKMGVMATINQPLDQETAILIVEELGHAYTLHKEETIEETVLIDSSAHEGKSRAPVVTIMGHVDHGKTSLLDYIRKARIAAGEAGGITQHIGAYSVKTPKGKITFLDTPGHEAFTAMRARGAGSTDIVILVVAADDGVMPQTIEAIQHAKAAGVPIVVAVNKIDKPEADPDRVKNELSQHDVIPEDWGGDVMFTHVSAKSGEGIDDLLDAILLQAEVLELKAVDEGFAKGVVIESKLEKGRGAVATVLVQSGCLSQGDIVLCGTEYGRIRAMTSDTGQKIKQAGPSTPVEILGLSGVPNAGDEMIAVKDDKTAREVAEHRAQKKKEERLKQQQASKLSSLFDRMGEAADGQQTLNVILKADVQGSVEAIRDSLTKLSNDDIKVEVIASGIGGITSSDVSLALASQAVLFGFNVRADASAKKQAESEDVELRYYSVIYDLIEDVKQAMSGLLSPELREQIIGVAEVRDVFRSSKFGSIAGCMVIDGVIKRNNPIRVLRDQVVIYEGTLESLKRFKEDANEVKKGLECGIGVKNYNDVKAGDQIEVFETIEVKREI
ncbi:translation initiation factor IF-2 [Facilibium subflavum]|nr:translation initiation factor IF-2 [Facilibium subflavum]